MNTLVTGLLTISVVSGAAWVAIAARQRLGYDLRKDVPERKVNATAIERSGPRIASVIGPIELARSFQKPIVQAETELFPGGLVVSIPVADPDARPWAFGIPRSAIQKVEVQPHDADEVRVTVHFRSSDVKILSPLTLHLLPKRDHLIVSTLQGWQGKAA